MKALILFSFIGILFYSCSESANDFLFDDVSAASGIDFENTLTYTEDFNPYTYRNFFNGGGVALGDINNDGWLDIYLTGNLVDNKLYLNKGDWDFEDITSKAGVACENVWSSGATFADVNGDGWLDLYVCKSGLPEGENRSNQLFINNRDNTFSDQTQKYNLGIEGLSTHAAFFDFDKDGDLDVYILTNSGRSVGVGFDLIENQREIPDPSNGGNKFLRNDDGFYIDITQEAGIYSSEIGFGLGITLGDFNKDDWTDIFISNDFFERDYLYINDQNGAFEEKAEEYFRSLSMGSMGADVGDLNNDGNLDLIVTEMLPQSIERRRTKTMFESWNKYKIGVDKGYYHQFSRNVLQRNTGNNDFLEIGRFSGIAATEWSWGALLFDMNNDGLKDIFIANGIAKDLLDRDYLNYMANPEEIREMIRQKENVIESLLEKIPSVPLANSAYLNHGDFIFHDETEKLGFGKGTFSNGSAYGDLDNDGDIDLVVNNINMPAQVFENKTDTSLEKSIRIQLIGLTPNTSALGSKISIWSAGKYYFAENFPSRGFQSSVDPIIHFGLGNVTTIDSVLIQWNAGGYTIKRDLKPNSLYEFKEIDKLIGTVPTRNTNIKTLQKSNVQIDSYRHNENLFSDFDREPLLVQMCSNEGPDISIGDINGDGIDDLFVGGAKTNQSGLFIGAASNFKSLVSLALANDFQSEDIASVFFDCDNDGDQDLFVCSGGRAFSLSSNMIQDRLYINNGSGDFSRDPDRLPHLSFSSSSVAPYDFDQDGDTDLIIGERFHPSYYGLDGGAHLLTNDGKGFFTDRTDELLPELATIGMVTDLEWIDIDQDGLKDLILVGDWMGIKIFINKDGKLENRSESYLASDMIGWWNCIEPLDFDNDGDMDFVVGNHGKNSFLKTGIRMYIADFDDNGRVEHIICEERTGKYYPIADRDELTKQIPGLNKTMLYYNSYSSATMDDLFSPEKLKTAEIYEAENLSTTLFVNEGETFRPVELPAEAQYTSIYAIASDDINDDGIPDLILGGNQHNVKPQFGRFDGLNGLILFGTPKGYNSDNLEFLDVKGQIRDIEIIENNNKKLVIFAINNGPLEIYEKVD